VVVLLMVMLHNRSKHSST